MSDFGRLIGITATNIYKSFATDVEVQIKISCSLIEGSKYVVPTLLRSDVPDVAGAGDLDIAVEDALAVLVVDGQHHDGVNYTIVKNDHTGKCRLKFKDGTTKIDFAAYPISLPSNQLQERLAHLQERCIRLQVIIRCLFHQAKCMICTKQSLFIQVLVPDMERRIGSILLTGKCG